MTRINENNLGILNISGCHKLHLGRVSQDNDIVLAHPAISAHHSRLEQLESGIWWVYDLDSDHGTYVNNQQVGPAGCPLQLDTDTLWIAPFALRITTQSGGQQPSPAHLRLDIVNLERRVGSRILLNLQGSPLSFSPGEFIAVVGGSGAGKSTFLKALLNMDTIQGSGRSGDVYFNNQLFIHGTAAVPFSPLNTIIGYVPQQDDSIHQQLTAIEALDYSTRLRFASDVGENERIEYLQNALKAVKIDRPEMQTRPINQLSGGQRKRVNVAMELVVQPRVLFLDEPTSGLDPGLDLEMMRLLKSWTVGQENQDPKTIVLITHATENIRLCDQVVFLGRTRIGDQESGGKLLYLGPPGETAGRFFGKETFSEVYQVVENPESAGGYHQKLVTQTEWSQSIWSRSRSEQDVKESQALAARAKKLPQKNKVNWQQLKRQFRILAQRYWLLLRRDRGAFLFQTMQGILIALLLWAVAQQDAFSIAGIRAAPTTLLIMSIAATWLGILNATKEIVKERRIYGRERRYGIGPVPYVLSKFFVLGGLGLWQMGSLIVVLVLRMTPESRTGTFGRALPSILQGITPLEAEWFITLELLLLSGLAAGLFLSSFSNSLDQASMFMFPAMLVQILLAGILFDVGPLAWLSFSHWGIRALGNSLNLKDLFSAAGKASDPVLDKLNFTSNGWLLLGEWAVLALFIATFLALTCWRQSWSDKARIPEN